MLIVIVPVSLWPTDSKERTLSLLRPRRMIGQSRSPTPWTSLEFLDPSAGQESEDSYPASIHGPPCGFPIPFLPRTEETEMEPGAGLARAWPGPAAGPAVPLSAITALPSIGGILQELPEIIEKAAAWRGLLVPPAQESSLAGGRSVSPGYRPSGVTRSGRASRPSRSARRERRPLGA